MSTCSFADIEGQTGGYPSLSIREFLHLLSSHSSLQAVPILFFSDHDVYGFDIYQVLKYGSRATAWASPTLVCSRLQWAGPIIDALESAVKTQAELRTEEPGWEKKMTARLTNRMKKKVLTPEGSARHSNMLKSGVLELPGEDEVRKEIWQMVRLGKVCSHQTTRLLALGFMKHF